MERIYTDPVVAKHVATGRTKVFDTEEEAKSYAADKNSYFYTIECEDRKGKQLDDVYGVPK